VTKGLSNLQIGRLLKPIDPNAIEVKQGMSYIAQYEVRAELNRVFGFGNWDTQVESMELLYETRLENTDSQYPANARDKSKPYWVACYRASVRLTIRDYDGEPLASYVEYHVEENSPLPNRGEAHAMAVTSVESYAMRRAAINLGDRFGLSLYDKGSPLPVVKGTLQLHERTVAGTSPAPAGGEDNTPDVPLGEPTVEAVSEARSALQNATQSE
jgi:recombination DNA repair RAD52 pathway protein